MLKKKTAVKMEGKECNNTSALFFPLYLIIRNVPHFKSVSSDMQMLKLSLGCVN